MCFKATVTALSSSKGTRPVISSKKVIPNEYISDCGVAWFPWEISGAK